MRKLIVVVVLLWTTCAQASLHPVGSGDEEAGMRFVPNHIDILYYLLSESLKEEGFDPIKAFQIRLQDVPDWDKQKKTPQ